MVHKIRQVNLMSDPSQDLPHDTRLPTLLRRLLAATESTEQSGLRRDAGDLGPAPPIPESPDVLKVLIDEARSFLNALEPVRKNLRLMVKLLDGFRSRDSNPSDQDRFLQDLAATYREKVLNLGPAIYGLMPHVEWDRESVRALLTTFGTQENGPTVASHPSPETRLKGNVAAIECFAERIQDLYRRLLDKLNCRSRPVATVVAKYPEEDRDRWIYERLWAGLGYKEVLSQLEDEGPKQGWGDLTSTQALRYAAKKYARLKQLPEIPSRKAPRK